jgi:chaperonin GroES
MADKTIQPIGDRVLVEPVEAETKTPGGIIIPDSAKSKPQRATIIAIGGAVTETALKVGDVVLYAKYTGTEVELDGKKYLILPTTDVLARV